jgi:hypothetical protein
MTTLSFITIPRSEVLMKKIFMLFTFFLFMSAAYAQDITDADQYPELDPAELEGSEFSNPRGIPSTDYEDVPREEQESVPEQSSIDEMPPEEIYEADEEYLE